jgi:hypothetical protein
MVYLESLEMSGLIKPQCSHKFSAVVWKIVDLILGRQPAGRRTFFCRFIRLVHLIYIIFRIKAAPQSPAAHPVQSI